MKLIYVAQLASNHDRDKLWVDQFYNHFTDVSLFSTYPYELMMRGFMGKIQNRLHFGSIISSMRNNLINLAQKIRPDWVHFRLPIHFNSRTIRYLKKLNAITTTYYNDDPFSIKQPLGLHRLFKQTIPYYDHHFVFRKKNVTDFISYGAKSVSHLKPFYSTDKLFLGNIDKSMHFEYDAVFIGHWEADNRKPWLEKLAAQNFRVAVRGSIWSDVLDRNTNLLGPFNLVFGDDFSKLYRSARAGICFFSKINNDQWTRRPLEIIASGGLLVCERTPESITYFQENEEAFFFSSLEELIQIVQYIRNNPDIAMQVRKRGRDRLFQEKHTLNDRITEMVDQINTMHPFRGHGVI